MKIIKRETTIPKEINTNEYFPHCQASFNSDGFITLRNYDRSNKSNDEIILLSKPETEALFELFSKLGKVNNNYKLPF